MSERSIIKYEKGKLRRTASKKISAFSKFFTYLEREGILDKNYLNIFLIQKSQIRFHQEY